MKYNMDKIERVLNRDEIIVAGHRGMREFYPENTLLSMQEAINRGVDMLEFDLNLTKDKQVVVIHDNTIDRTTNGTGYVHDMTLEELKGYDAGIRKGVQFEGLKIPTLRELCELCAPYKELLFNVEIKERTHETVDLGFAILKEFGLMERCVFVCFDASILAYMADTYHVKCAGFPREYMDNFVDGKNGTYSKMFGVGISMRPFESKPDMRTLSPQLVREFVQMGIEPWCFCPDNEQMVNEAISCGVRLMTCNNPLPALKILRERSLHPRSIALPEN